MYLTNALKNKIVSKIREVIIPDEIILFGSYATGSATEDSDIYLLNIEKKLIQKLGKN